MRKKRLMALLLLSVLALAACSKTVEESARTAENFGASRAQAEKANKRFCGAGAGRNQESTVADYVSVWKNSAYFDGKTVTVAGRIDEIGTSEFWFRERLGFQGAEVGLYVHLKDTEAQLKAAGLTCDQGDYVLVQGTWYDGDSAYSSPALWDAAVLAVGERPKRYADAFLNQWYAAGQSYMEAIPLVDYMDIADDPGAYTGQRVRVAGKMESFGKNVANWSIFFYFRDRGKQMHCISVSLAGCPQSMQKMCKEDDYVILSGVVGENSITDCFVECTGTEAEEADRELEKAWWQKYHEEREAYIAACAPCDYEQMVSFPEDCRGDQVMATGTVVQLQTRAGEPDIVMDIGKGHLVGILYSGKMHREMEILRGDKITFYGICCGKADNSFSEDMGRVPMLEALYSSINP